ncbi:MAG: DinB family protein [Armatimonadota bacterium]|nr:DinB family protein [Armatimonadota bacterium]MDR7485787.1 DinB family protein [Armatimonadota bacterium]MDR7532083.1 DinB family protein [Armatimonadota bacterium]MDR7537521.1 DinB family protein [Armatimonadota bacterium]
MRHPAGLHPAEAYDYLVLARGMLLGWIRTLAPEQYAREFPIGHKSIRATLVHVTSAEWGYVRRLRGEPAPPIGERPFARYAGEPFEPLERAWAAQAEETRRTLQAVGDWSRPVEYVASLGGRPRRFRTTTGGVAVQLLFHEVHHRAQVMAMLRQMGIAAENLDYSVLGFQVEDIP